MIINRGSFDRVIRIVIAVIIAYLFYVDYISGVVGMLLLVVAGFFIGTSLAGFCPLYKMLGITSFKKK